MKNEQESSEIDDQILQKININTQNFVVQNQNASDFNSYVNTFNIAESVKTKYGLKDKILSCYFEKSILEDPPERILFVLLNQRSSHPDEIKEYSEPARLAINPQISEEALGRPQ